MGLFSGKKVTTVSTSTSGLIQWEDPIPSALMTAIFSGDGIPETIIKTLLSGIGVKARRAQNYARDYYALGLPTGQPAAIGSVTDVVLAGIIATDIAYPNGVTVIENLYTTATPGFLILDDLIATRGYNPATNEISIYPAGIIWPSWCALWIEAYEGVEATPYLECNRTSTQSEIDLAPKRITIHSIYLSYDGLSADVTYGLFIKQKSEYPTGIKEEWVNTGIIEESFLIPNVANITIGEDVVFATYVKLDALGVPLPGQFSWVYYLSDGTYPALSLEVNVNTTDEYLPVIPIRYYNEDYTDPARDTIDPLDLYTTSDKLMKKWGFNFKRMGNLINQNPSVGDIDHAYIMFGVDLQTNVPASLLYLFNFFNLLYQTQDRNKLDYLTGLASPVIPDQPQNTYLSSVPGGLTDFGESGLNLVIKYDYIESELRVGKIGNGRIGNTRKSFKPYTVVVPAYVGWLGAGVNDPDDFSEPSYKYVIQTRYKMVLESQVSKLTVRQITVVGLETKNTIYIDYNVVTTLLDIATDINNHSLFLPLNYNLAQSMKLIHRNALYADASLMVINTWDVQKGAWYTSGFFKFVLIVVAVIITVFSAGTQAWLVGLAGALGAGVMATIMYLLPVLIGGILLKYALTWLVVTFGAKLGIIGAILIAVAAVVIMVYAPSAAKSLMATAQKMLQIAQSLVSTVNEFLVEEGQQIYNEYQEFEKDMDKRWEELNTTIDAMDFRRVDIDPLTFTHGPRFKSIPNESPDMFFQRTLGLADNTYYVIHDEISSFSGSKLTLERNIPTDLYI